MQGLRHAERGTCIECMYYINFMYFSLTPSFLENLVSPPLKIISKKNPDKVQQQNLMLFSANNKSA